MRRNESRNKLPLPVAPIPEIRTFSIELEVSEVVDRLDIWYAELSDWLHIWRRRNAMFFRRLPRIQEQIRLLLQSADQYLPESLHTLIGVKKRSKLALYHELLAISLSAANDWETDGEAVNEFKLAMSLAPDVANYWYSYVRHLVRRDSIGEALDEINSVELRVIQSEQETIAQQIVNWSLAYPEIGFGIRADIIKHCIALISRARTGLLVRACPFPRSDHTKWQRTEIIRVLFAGMQCSVPIDELCKREGIDEATYYRWRKRYLPPEWGDEPALV